MPPNQHLTPPAHRRGSNRAIAFDLLGAILASLAPYGATQATDISGRRARNSARCGSPTHMSPCCGSTNSLPAAPMLPPWSDTLCPSGKHARNVRGLGWEAEKGHVGRAGGKGVNVHCPDGEGGWDRRSVSAGGWVGPVARGAELGRSSAVAGQYGMGRRNRWRARGTATPPSRAEAP
jgi:hypothetical protein